MLLALPAYGRTVTLKGLVLPTRMVLDSLSCDADTLTPNSRGGHGMPEHGLNRLIATYHPESPFAPAWLGWWTCANIDVRGKEGDTLAVNVSIPDYIRSATFSILLTRLNNRPGCAVYRTHVRLP